MKLLHERFSERQALEFKRRFNIIFIIIALSLALLIIRLAYLQLIKGDEFRQKSENNSIRMRKIRPPRGLIMDAKGQVLAENQPSFDILFAPNRIKDIEPVILKLRQFYAENSFTFSTDLSVAEKARPFAPVRLERNANREKVAVVETNVLDLPGVSVEVTPIRYYHDGEMMSHIVGYTGEITEKELEKGMSEDYSAGDIVGKYGIERYLDTYLKGKNGAEQIEVNVLGRKVKTHGMMAPASGYDVVLTIDASLQQTAWKAMGGKAGAVVVMDIRDGSILALVSSPAFDVNLFNGGISFASWEKLANDPSHPMENRVIAGQYPPGSTYKMIIAAAGLQEGLITPQKTFLCNGAYEMGNRAFRCWQKNGHGVVSLHRAIVESCDVYFYNLGRMLGVDKIAFYARQFGFGAATGVDLPREKNGLVPTKDWKLSRYGEPWQPGETISISIGQGYDLVTPLQLASAYAALANGGTLYQPHIIKRIQAADGVVYKEFGPQVINTLPVSKDNQALLSYAFWGAVNERGGTGYALKRSSEDMCGKTGTAQVIGLPENEKARRTKKIASEHRDHAWFVCYGPYKNPEVAVAVIIENGGHGASAAAPVARKIIDAYFSGKTKEMGAVISKK